MLKALFKRYDIDSLDNRNPVWIDTFYRVLHTPLKRYFRASVRGVERIPPGAALYVGNHNASPLSFDSYLFAFEAYRRHGMDAVPYGLGHEVGISLPLAHQFFVPLGAVRASHENALRLFTQGKKVLVYPGGDVDAMRPFRKRNKIVFGGRRGYIRLALRGDVPIIPVVAAGAHSVFYVVDDLQWFTKLLRLDKIFRLKVFPLTLSIPWGITLGPLPGFFPFPSRILIEVLDPIRFERSGAEAASDDEYVKLCAERVESLMQQTLDRLALERKETF